LIAIHYRSHVRPFGDPAAVQDRFDRVG
jgi:hypothetical protein